MSEVSAEEEFASPGGRTHSPLPFCPTESPCSKATVRVTGPSALRRFVKLTLARVDQEGEGGSTLDGSPGAESSGRAVQRPAACVLAAGP